MSMSSTTSANASMTQSWKRGSSGRAAGVPGGSPGEVPAGASTFVGRLMARLPEVATLEAATGREGPVRAPGKRPHRGAIARWAIVAR